jgi:ATP phosphoribosyltransferase regulatory subunit
MRATDVRLDVGHVALAGAALDGLDADLRAELEQLLAKKDRSGVARAARRLPASRRAVIEALPVLYGSPTSVARKARALRLPAAARRAVDTIDKVLAAAKETMDTGLHRRITVDLGEVRGFEYYTGIRFAGYVAGSGDSVLRGGRYDGLLARYGAPAAATGFAADIEAIAQTERVAGIAPPVQDRRVLIAPARDERRLAARIASALRASGYRAAVDTVVKRKPDLLRHYAAETGYARVLVVDARGGRMLSENDDYQLSVAALKRAARGDVSRLFSPSPAGRGRKDDA